MNGLSTVMATIRPAVRWLARPSSVVVAGLALACVTPMPRSQLAGEPVGVAWTATLVAVHRDMTGGRHASAERALRDFAAAYPGTAEAMESNYWRAVLALDPGNEQGSVRDATELLTRYLDSRLPLSHRAEATVLRRLAASVAAPARAGPPASAATGTDPRDAEIQRLKEELENTRAELERIRKRLAPPPPGTPPPTTPPPATTPPPTPPPTAAAAT